MVQVASQALGSDPATGGKGAEQGVEKAGKAVSGDKHKVRVVLQLIRVQRCCQLSLRVLCRITASIDAVESSAVSTVCCECV